MKKPCEYCGKMYKCNSLRSMYCNKCTEKYKAEWRREYYRRNKKKHDEYMKEYRRNKKNGI